MGCGLSPGLTKGPLGVEGASRRGRGLSAWKGPLGVEVI